MLSATTSSRPTARVHDAPPSGGRPEDEADPFAALDLGDPAIAASVHRLARASRSTVPILLHGETGTGKELFARAVHQASARAGGPFIAINCASIPEGLIESELFGYRAGAFTGASARGARGLFQQADGGTLFLDEIGDMPLALQARLLRVLAEQEVRPVGAEVAVKTDFRVVSATHRNLGEQVRQGAFREDLMFRLQGLTVTLPALRQRRDIGALAARLATAIDTGTHGRVNLAPCACRLLEGLPWPGNVRQLKQVLTTAAWLADAPVVRSDDILAALENCSTEAQAADQAPRHEATAEAPPHDERTALLASLRRNRWNVSRTAEEFNAARTTIYRRMIKLGIVQPHLLDA